MSNIDKLPVYKFVMGVQTDEDLSLAFSITDSAGAPVDLTAIIFTVFISTKIAQVAKLQGLVYGRDSNCLYFLALAADKAFITTGTYQLTILADDGALKHDLLGYSTLYVGAPQTIIATPLLTDEPNMSVVTILNPAVVASSNQALGAVSVTTTSAALPAAQLLNGALLKADKNNGGRVYVNVGADATTSSFWLDPGDINTFVATNLSQINLKGVQSGDRIGYVGV